MFNLDRALSLSMNEMKSYIKRAQEEQAICQGMCKQQDECLYQWYIYPDGRMQLLYSCDGTRYNYFIKIASVPSNLGLGDCFYFVCPEKGVLCRKLFFYRGRFVSRQAIPQAVYDCQLEQSNDALCLLFEMMKMMDTKNRKAYYKGKITPFGRKAEKCLAKVRAFKP